MSTELDNKLETRKESVLQVMNASEKLLRERFGQLAGLSYGGDRDIWEAAGYPEDYTFGEGWSRYKRQDITRRIVDLPVQRTWRHPPNILEGERDDTTFVEQWDDLWDDLGLQTQFEKADRMASIGEYSVVLMGFAGAATDQELRNPVDEGDVNAPEDVLYARPYKESDVTVESFVQSPGDSRFGRPETYRIDLSGGENKFQASSVVVHWTRVLHIVEDPLDSDVYGLPRLQRVLNRLIDLEKIVASTGEAYWQLITPILKAVVDEDADLSSADMDNLEDDLLDVLHDLRRHFISQGMDLEYLESDHAPDPSSASDLVMLLISAASGIPKRILFGTETGERASEQDAREFDAMIGTRVETYAEPTIVRQFTDRMILLGALEEPAEEYKLVWPDRISQTESEKAETDNTVADTASKLTPMGGDPSSLVTITEDSRVKLRPDEAQNASRTHRTREGIRRRRTRNMEVAA